MNVRELLWAVTYGYNRWAFRGNERAREIALDEATDSVVDFDEFFWEPGEDVPIRKPKRGPYDPEPIHPLDHVGAWEITDPITWEVAPGTLDLWREMHHWKPDDERAHPAVRRLISRSHHVKVLGANRELWRTSKNAGGWRLVVEPREGKASLVVWVGQGATPERFL